jgi:uncharacterized protein YodC (DUF2158 family)
MNAQYQISTPAGLIDATLTTDHPSSSYGRPVMVAADGAAYGTAECRVYSRYLTWDDPRTTDELLSDLSDPAKDAGYQRY